MPYRFRLLSSITVLVLILGLSIANSFPFYVFAAGPAVVQTKAQNGQSVSTINAAFSSNTVAGNRMIVFAQCTGTCSALTISDTQGNTFALITSNSISSTFFVNTYYVINIKSSAGDTITWSGGQSETNLGFQAFEISGVTSVGYLASTGGNGGVTCGCSTGSITIPSNSIALAGMNTNGNGGGSWTLTTGFTGVATPSNILLQAEYSTSAVGANTFSTSYSSALAGWAENSVVLNIAAPADFNVVLNSAGSAQANANTINVTCTQNYVFNGNTLVLILGIVGAGNTISTPSDSLGSVFTRQYNAGSQNPEIDVWTAAVPKDGVVDSLTLKDTAGGGHGALQTSCYQIQSADLGAPLALTNLHGNSTGPPTGCNSNTFCNVPEAGGSVGLFGVSCSSAVCINDVIYSLSGTGTNMCPTLMTFHNAQTDSGNTIGAADSNGHSSCGVDPGSSNKLIQVDNYGSGVFSTGNPSPKYTAISNITSGGLLAGSGFGAIFGFQNPTVTSTITGWVFPNYANCQGSGSPQCGTSINWFLGLIVMMIPVAIVDSAFIEISDNIDRQVLVFLTLLMLLVGSILATMLNFLPFIVPFVFGVIFTVYLWKGRG